MAVNLGDRVRDRVSGFTGVVIARTEWLYGCTRFGVQAEELKDGKPIEAEWFDERSLDPASPEPGGPAVGGVETG